jgi:hypothetical protein
MALDENGQPIPDTGAPVSAPLPRPLLRPNPSGRVSRFRSQRPSLPPQPQSYAHQDEMSRNIVRDTLGVGPHDPRKLQAVNNAMNRAGAAPRQNFPLAHAIGRVANKGLEGYRKLPIAAQVGHAIASPLTGIPMALAANRRQIGRGIGRAGQAVGRVANKGLEGYRKLPVAAQIGHAIASPFTGIPMALAANRKQIGRGIRNVGRGIYNGGKKVLGGIASLFKRRK